MPAVVVVRKLAILMDVRAKVFANVLGDLDIDGDLIGAAFYRKVVRPQPLVVNQDGHQVNALVALLYLVQRSKLQGLKAVHVLLKNRWSYAKAKRSVLLGRQCTLLRTSQPCWMHQKR